MKIFARFIGLLLLAGGFIALIVDGTRSIAGGELAVTTLRRGAIELFPTLYENFQNSVMQKAAFLWDPVLTTLMIFPVSLTFGVLGTALIVFGAKRDTQMRYWRQ